MATKKTPTKRSSTKKTPTKRPATKKKATKKKATKKKATKKKTVEAPSPRVYTLLLPKRMVTSMMRDDDGEVLDFITSWGNQHSNFMHYRIAPGDVLIPFHIHQGGFCPIARMTITFKGTIADWNAQHPDDAFETEHGQVLAGKDGTAMHFCRPLDVATLRALRYDGKEGPRPVKLTPDGRLVRAIGLEGVFRLTPESGDELLWLSWI